MRFLSVCSGIEAATVASRRLGWQAVGYAEIDPFCCVLLKEKYPDVPNYGDFTAIKGDELGPVDAIVGGTPCQDFSVAGKRAGLDGERGNLTLEFVRPVGRVRPRWVFWENVPGVLSIDGGRAFGAFLGALGQLGYGWSYRVLNARYFGPPCDRQRIFVVGCARGWQPAGAVLLEQDPICDDIPQERNRKASLPCLMARRPPRLGGSQAYVVEGRRLRFLTPREYERLQGFPDDYTLINYRGKPAADGPRYKALGNSWAVPCVEWVFERMDAVDRVLG